MELKSADWAQLKALFESMLDMESSARLEFLDRQDIPDELRGALQDLLQSHEEAHSFLNHPALLAAGFDSAVPHSSLAKGALLAERFRIVRFRARGGMGEVYEAEDLELHTPVAIKTIRPEIANYPGTLSRFKREVHLAKQVTHPNVCRIFDIFRHRDPAGDVVFLSMELLSGQTLAECIRERGRIPEEEAVTILRQVASALHSAHSAGVLHRDLKPGNIVIETDRSGEIRAVITDFGMAWSGDSHSDAPQTTKGPLAFGTPEFMSPEQIEGKELTPASDVYSLGLVSYQMITGVRAFEADTPLFSALRRLTEPPLLPSRVIPQIGPQWDGILSRCLDRDPERRFASAQEFASALETRGAWPAKREGRPAATRRWFGAHRILVFSLAAALLILAAAAFVARWWFDRKQVAGANPTVVIADFVNTTGEPVFDSTLNTALFAKLQQSPFLNLMPDSRVRVALRYMGAAGNGRLPLALARQVCLREGGQTVLQGAIANGAGGYDLWLRAYDCADGKLIAGKEVAAGARDSALTALDQAADAMRAQLGESLGSIRQYDVGLEDASTPSLEALTAYSQGLRLSNEEGEVAAEPFFQRAVQIDPEFAIAYARIASLDADMGEPERAREAAIQAYERRGHTSQWEQFFILSCYYAFATGELNKELQTYEEWGRVYPRDTVWPSGLMIDYSYFGEFDKAAAMAQLQIRNDPETAAAYGNLAEIYLALNRPDEAAAILDRADQAHLHEINLDWERYLLAFYNSDSAGMHAVVSHAADYPGLQETMLAQQATTEAYRAHIQSARAFTQKAAQAAVHSGDKESAAVWQAEQALWEAEFGLKQAQGAAVRPLGSDGKYEGKTAAIVTALAAATAGNEHQAEASAARLAADYPLDSMLRDYWLPLIRARVALRKGKPAQAIQLLESTTPYATGAMIPLPCMYSVYVQGLAHIESGEPSQAAADFRAVLDHRGLVLNCPTGSLARLGLARALSRAHDVDGSRAAYRDLLEQWNGADATLALPRQAAAEYRALH